MVVGVLALEFFIEESNSLKDKRQVIKSLLEHIRNRFNVSAAELGELDSWRKSIIGVACISNDQSVANTVLNKILDYVESNPRVAIVTVDIDFL